VVQVQEKEDWPEHRTIISLLLEAFGLTNHTVEDVLWAVGKSRQGKPRCSRFSMHWRLTGSLEDADFRISKREKIVIVH
jgi:hypothetical protein